MSAYFFLYNSGVPRSAKYLVQSRDAFMCPKYGLRYGGVHVRTAR